MRENRPSGLEGGARSNPLLLPLSIAGSWRRCAIWGSSETSYEPWKTFNIRHSTSNAQMLPIAGASRRDVMKIARSFNCGESRGRWSVPTGRLNLEASAQPPRRGGSTWPAYPQLKLRAIATGPCGTNTRDGSSHRPSSENIQRPASNIQHPVGNARVGRRRSGL